MVKSVFKNSLLLKMRMSMCLLLVFVLFPVTVNAVTLSGNQADAPSNVNLSAGSPADWVHWGYVPIELDRKAGVTQQITDYSTVGGADPGSWDQIESGYSWSDGLSPGGNVSNTRTGKRVFQVGKGFQFSVPASTSLKTLRVYVGSKGAQGKLTATLSGENYNVTVNPGGGLTSRVITLKYRASSNGQKLVIKYVVTKRNTSNAYITLESAALEDNGGSGGATLSGAMATAPSTVNLTQAGSTDWVHWGRISDEPWDRKQGITALISDLDRVGYDVSPSPTSSDSAYSWSDGRPSVSVLNTRSGLRVFDKNKGFTITAPADTSTKTLVVYVGLNGKASGDFTASLSGGGDKAFNTVIQQSSGKNTVAVTLTYQAASNGQKLTIEFVRNVNRARGSWITMESAALFQGSGGSSGGGAVVLPLSPPSGMTASDNTFTDKIALTWDSVAGATRYDIYRSSASGSNGSEIAAPENASYNDTSAVAGTIYYYRTKACNSAGCSGFSSQVAGSRAGGSSGGVGGALSGSPAIAPNSVDLSVVGSSDWVHWGLSSRSDVDRKAGVVAQISDYSPIGGATPSRSNSVSSAYLWNDGSPTMNVSKTTTGLRVFNVDKGIQFSVPADTESRTLKVYVGANNATGRFIASLSDKSAPDYTVAIKQPTGVTSRVITLKYKAKSSGQTLVVKYVVESKPNSINGMITLESAALAGGGVVANLPPTINSIVNVTIAEGQVYSAMVSAQDSDGPSPLTLSESNTLPGSPNALADLGNGSGKMEWVSATGDAAGSPYEITVKATDGAGASTSMVAKITVRSAGGGSGGSLSGMPASPQSMVNLSTEGTSDWVHWGLRSKTDVDRKAGVATQISNLATIGDASAPRMNRTKIAYSWVEGTPTASVSNSTTGLRIYNVGKGFQFTVPADSNKRTLKVYLSANSAQGEFVASLSDGSAPDFVTVVDANATVSKAIALSYRAASAGQALLIRYVVESKPNAEKGWIGLQSATLQADDGSAGGSLSGTFANAPKHVVLSNIGEKDWIHWGLKSKTSVDRKAGVTQSISNFTAIGDVLAPRVKNTGSSYSWVEGEPTSRINKSTTGLRIYNVGKGIEFSAPASKTPRTLSIYLDARQATGRLIASLSDGSSAEYTVAIDPSTSRTSKVVTLSYQANSLGQSLKVRYTMESKPGTGGWIMLESAALK